MKTSISIARFYRSAFVLGSLLTFLGGSSTNLFGDVAYLRSNTGSVWDGQAAPFSPGSNEAAMDTVFGSDGWSNLRYETVDVSLLFSSTNTFIFLEGGDSTANSLKNFLTTNEALITNWVSNGGRLFLNAAPNEGSGMDFGFGISLNFSNGNQTHSNYAYPVDGSHAIFHGPYGEAEYNFYGDWFSHATVSGSGLNPLITGDVGTILGEMNYGDGFILAGGMTLARFHYERENYDDNAPQQGAYDLLANIIAYGAGITSPIPEPSSYALMTAVSALGLVAIRRRSK